MIRFGKSGKIRHFRSPEIPFGVQWLLAPDGEGGGGSRKRDDDDEDELPRRRDPVVIATRFNNDVNALARHIDEVEGDHYRTRRKRDALQTELDALKGKVPAEGAVVLTGEDAAAWTKYQALGKPDELSTDLTRGREALTRTAEFDRTQTLEEAAKIDKLKPGMLKMLTKDANVQLRDVDVADADGNVTKAKRPFVVVMDGDKEKSATPLRDHFKAQGDDVLETLEAGDVDYSTQNNSNGNTQNSANSVAFPVQGAGGGGKSAKENPAGNLINSRYAPPAKTQA